MIKSIFFDLDGTLLDTSYDLANAANNALEKLNFGKKRYSAEEIKFIVGHGQDSYMRTIIPKENYTEENIALLKKEYTYYYRAHIDEKTIVYEGINELINFLYKKGVKLFCLTNKNHISTNILLNKFFDTTKFTKIQGIEESIIPKPDPSCLNNLIKEFSLNKEEAVMVGDTEYDILVGKNASIRTIGAAWGFKGKNFLEEYSPTYIAEKPLDIIEIVENDD